MKETRRKNTVAYKGTRITIIEGFSTEMTQIREWSEIVTILEE